MSFVPHNDPLRLLDLLICMATGMCRPEDVAAKTGFSVAELNTLTDEAVERGRRFLGGQRVVNCTRYCIGPEEGRYTAGPFIELAEAVRFRGDDGDHIFAVTVGCASRLYSWSAEDAGWITVQE